MLNWNLITEYYSFCILLILFVRYLLRERHTAATQRSRMFMKCLALSMGFIVLNVVCVITLKYGSVVPVWLNMLLNTAYFLASICIASLYAYLVFDALLEHVYDKHCIRRARMVLSIVVSVSTILTLVNLFTGLVFTIDDAGVYHRGPLNRAYYILLLAEVFFVCLCYIRNRKSVSDKMVYAMRTIPIIVVLLCGLQFLFPDVLLNGTISAVVSLLIFAAFRSNTEEQDALTGANSRKAFMQELSLRSGNGQSLQIMQIALLNMADVNIRYNYTVGDALLYEISHFLRHSLPNVQVFRTGGTTFTVILPYESDEAADAALAKIQSRLQSVWNLGDVHCHVFVAIAELREPDLSISPVEMVERIEYTMSIAKANPPLAHFDAIAREKMERRSTILDLMRRSIDENRFSVYYQPLYCCRKDIFCSAEALLRLNDYDGNPVSPAVFIPLAEESGLIEELTWLVLDDICRILTSGRYPSLQYVTLNLSMKQLLDPDFPTRLACFLDDRKVSHECLKVEMTERFILLDEVYARQQMELIESLGIQISMDDFGTGYSNLSSVLEYPFSFIKLDRSLITPVAENEQARAMVAALINMFKNMDKRVVAEGVETKEQNDILRSLGIDMIQGFYYARPAPAEDQLPRFFSDI